MFRVPGRVKCGGVRRGPDWVVGHFEMRRLPARTRATLWFMPSYKDSVYSFASVGVRPTGRRNWPLIRQLWPYFRGSSLNLTVTVKADAPVDFRWSMKTEAESELEHHEWVRIPAGQSEIAIGYPGDRVLPAGRTRVRFALKDTVTPLHYVSAPVDIYALELDSLILPAIVSAGVGTAIGLMVRFL